MTQLSIFEQDAVAAPRVTITPPTAAPTEPGLESEPEGMSQASFIALHRTRFVRNRGCRRLLGVRTIDGTRVLDLPPGCQKSGKLLRPVDEVLGEIHRAAVEARVTQAIRAKLPTASPWEAGVAAPPAEVLADYPDLAQAVALGVTPGALALLAAQPTEYVEVSRSARSVSELKRILKTGVALTRFADAEPPGLHVVVRKTRRDCFAWGPVTGDLLLAQRFAEDTWHSYLDPASYKFGPTGFDVTSLGLSYRYGHVPLDQPCPMF